MTDDICTKITREGLIQLARDIEAVSSIRWRRSDSPIAGALGLLKVFPTKVFRLVFDGKCIVYSSDTTNELDGTLCTPAAFLQAIEEQAPLIAARQIEVVYIAGPFRAENAWKVERNIRAAEKLAFKVASRGYYPLCPHTMTRFFNGTLTDSFWLESTMELLRRCDALLTVGQDWQMSSGTLAEVKAAIDVINIPVYHTIMDLERK